ncbi:hypothetical protein [Micromonospora sp. WMMB235]|uniref:hypothetical protein n=1 Tax=Micromonospora sp. WMMB235 TaxID=1172030 RepID=UPI0008D919D4|nr:hypothetical protein [Micromonospora sp. WMMB235]OHX02989.1 hypothetical protein BFV98_08260 [Micromonospora sp. WMMB235]
MIAHVPPPETDGVPVPVPPVHPDDGGEAVRATVDGADPGADPSDADEQGLAEETEETEETEDDPSLDPREIIGRLSALLGAPAGIEVGDVHVQGQNATGTGATAIGAMHVTMAGVGDGRSWSETLSGATVRQSADGYAPASSDQHLDRRLKRRGLLCLSGPEGTGRYTAACLASARRHGYDRVGLINVESLGDLIRTAGILRAGHGYVLPLSDAAIRELDGMTLVGAAARAEAVGCTVVLVGDFQSRGREFTDQIVEHRPPGAADVFRAQLRRHLRGRCVGRCGNECVGACVDRYVEDEAVGHPLMMAYLRGDPRPGEVVRLVDSIARNPVNGMDLTQRLERLLPGQVRERAARILDCSDGQHPSEFWAAGDRRAFRMSCAVLAGQPVSEVHHAARLLTGPAADDLPQAVMPGRGSALDELMGPELRQAVRVVDDDRVPGGRRVEFIPANDALRSSLLEVAWQDWWHPERLLRWWIDLARSDVPGVRQAAAGAIGWSASLAVRSALLAVDELARERRAGVRQTAAIALVAMAMQPSLRHRLRAELDRWADSGTAHRRDTVARAYALGLARLWPESALLHLRQVAEARMQRWHNSVVRGLVEVYDAGYTAEVTATLAEWAVSAHPEVRLHAGRALRILADRWSPAPREHWPELLDLTRRGTVQLQDLATCWAAALAIPGTAFRAWRTLGFWLSRADGQPEVALYCRQLLTAVVAGREPLRRRLDHQIQHVWQPLMPGNSLLDDVRRLTNEEQR